MDFFTLFIGLGMLISGTCLGAWLYRLRGMPKEEAYEIPKIVRVLAYCAVFAIAYFAITFNWIFALAVIPLMIYGVLVGHGSYFPRNPDTPNVDNEIFAPITKRIANPLNNKARFVGMCLTGLTQTIPLAILAMFTMNWWASLYAFVGILKGFTYFKFTKNTEEAEYIWGGISACLWILMLLVLVL